MSLPAQRSPEPAYLDVEPIDESGSPAALRFLRKLLLALRRFWWLPVLTLLLGAGGGAYLYWTAEPTYVSNARMHEPIRVRLPEGGLFSEDLQNFLGTQSALLQAGPIRDLAMERLRAVGGVRIPTGPDGQPERVSVRMAPVPKSSVFVLQATGSDARYTQAYLNALMDAYLEFKRTMRKLASSETLTSITEQVQRAERDLTMAQDIFSTFQRSNNLAILQEEGTIAGGYLARLRTQLADLELEAQILRSGRRPTPVASALPGPLAQAGPAAATPDVPAGDWPQAEAAADGWPDPPLVSAPTPAPLAEAGGGEVAAPSGPDAELAYLATIPPEIQGVLRERAMLEAQRDRLSQYLRPKHPKMVRLSDDIARVDRMLEIYGTQEQRRIDAALAALGLKMASVRDSIREWESKVVEANTRISEAERLRVHVQRAQSVHDRLMLLVQNVGISRNIEQDTMAVLEPASVAERTRRKELAMFGASAVGGLCFGIGILALLAFRDDRFQTPAELVETLGGGVVGHVPDMPLGRSEKTLPLLALDDPRYMFAEAYRSLRSALLYLVRDDRAPRSLLVTSAIPGEGKSTVASNLARAIAFGGAKVVLIDADMRKGHLHELLGAAKEPGLTEALRNPDRLADFIQADLLPNLGFIARGKGAANPGDLLTGPKFERLLRLLREQYDYVLFDSSPIFAADDSATMAPRLDGALLVVRRGFSRAAQVTEAIEVLQQRQARILGMVFNRANASLRSYHYYKYADYYRGVPPVAA
ncbi:MAG: polysaccharide biosynthesis tyrosine autokinase [Verrucomicrobiae bacterium]|nr:polysaccharide biosynthesis tyrosine autokinase [Verrucomicrobiae bacterium]